MPTTTNYGWTTPADTDLVKDGASAIRTLGTAIDTTVFNNASAAIAKTIVDAKGDIIAATAADTVSRLAVGANNTVLTADSSTATGLKWAAPSGLTLLSTTTLSGASTTISSIDQTYTDLVIVIYGMTNASSNGGIVVKPNNTSSISNHVLTDCTSSSAATSVNNQNSDILMTYNSLISRTDANNAFVLTINNYANTTFYKPFSFYGQALAAPTSYKYSIISGGNIATNSAITSFNFSNNGGNWSTGTVLIYGVK